MCPSFCLCSSQLVYPPLQSDGSLARSRLAVICGPASASPAVTASEVPSWREHLFPEPLGGLPLTASSRKCHQLKRSHLSKAEAAPVTGGSQRAKVQPPCHNLGQLLGATPSLSIAHRLTEPLWECMTVRSTLLNLFSSLPPQTLALAYLYASPAASHHFRGFQQVSEPQLERDGAI